MIKTPLSTMIGGAFWTPKATILGGTSKNTFDQLIKALFANGEQGFFYDPNDLSTMYQVAAGTVPVTGGGQPVGLVLDKSKGLALSPELNSNPTFNESLAGWVVGRAITAELVDGQVRLVGGGVITSTDFNWFGLNVIATGSPVYTIEFDATWVSGGNLQCGASYNLGLTVTPQANQGVKKRYKYTVVPHAVGPRYACVLGAALGAVWLIDNVSVKEITGNHAYQTTSAARPILQDAPRRIDFDAVDDKLITNLPAQLTGCTVVRSVPNVGTQILTGQTIPTPYNDNTDHCGLIVINRALTPSETSIITSEFNKRAGV